jgi:hypothetical protein
MYIFALLKHVKIICIDHKRNLNGLIQSEYDVHYMNQQTIATNNKLTTNLNSKFVRLRKGQSDEILVDSEFTHESSAQKAEKIVT